MASMEEEADLHIVQQGREIVAKTTITANERLQLIGLLTVAESQMKQLEATEKAAGELLGAKDDSGYYGHVSDAIYDNGRRDADGLLERMGISVEAA